MSTWSLKVSLYITDFMPTIGEEGMEELIKKDEELLFERTIDDVPNDRRNEIVMAIINFAHDEKIDCAIDPNEDARCNIRLKDHCESITGESMRKSVEKLTTVLNRLDI